MKLNNPFNIRVAPKNHWRGALPFSKNFECFRNTVYSVRAFIIIVSTYRYKYNITTVFDIIHRYAPEVENDTRAYISYICKRMKCLPDQEINYENLFEFARAVAYMESNYQLTKQEFQKALSMTNY